VEAVRVIWDPSRVSYRELLDTYWQHTDPTDGGGQFVDRGPQYRPIVFWADDQQRSEAEASKAALGKSGKFKTPIAAEIRTAEAFTPAEDYHQDYVAKNPARYQEYFMASGRPEFFTKVWGKSVLVDPAAPPNAVNGQWQKPPAEQLRKTLTPCSSTSRRRTGPSRPSRTSISTTSGRASTSTSSPVSLCSAPPTSRIRHRLAKLHPAPGTGKCGAEGG